MASRNSHKVFKVGSIPTISTNTLELGMPHLNYNGIDPVWLSKTIAEAHWNFLKHISSINEKNQRLYASIFFCEIDFNQGQNLFREFDIATINSQIYKFNNQIYRSTHSISSELNTATATLDSIFVKKDLTSGTLIRDNPVHSDIDFEYTETISLEEHKKIKIKYSDIKNEELFNELVFNPEAYFNGVRLLYFANYLNLVYQNEYLTFKNILDPIKKIEIYFFSNITLEDKVFGYTEQIGNVYETVLTSNKNKLMSVCRFIR